MEVYLAPFIGLRERCYSEFQNSVNRYEDTSAFILSGGASSRMGCDKGLLKIHGQALIVRTARVVKPLVSSVKVVGPPDRYKTLGLRVIADRKFNPSGKTRTPQGPLAAIATALAATETTWNLILACDLPYLTGEWVDWLLAHATNSQQQMVVPRTARGLEPLAAVYRRDCAEPLAALVACGVRKVVEAIEQFPVEFVLERDWQPIDSDGRVLQNMNTPADYDEALSILEKR
jgi:molybdenum cofactor guanylyltransferase